MKSNNLIISIAAIIGLVVTGAWAFRVLDRFFYGLTWWFRYNGIYVIAAIAILWIIGTLLFGKDKS